MKKLTLAGLLICNFVIFTLGNGTVPLMPIYSQLLGSSKGVAGLYVAFAYLCLAAGTILGGKLSDRVSSRRILLIVTSAPFAPLVWLMGVAVNVWQLSLVTGFLWLLAGVGMAAMGAIMGREAHESERGKVFGFMGMTMGLGSLAGGLGIGPMVDAWGYAAMFSVLAGFTVIVPVIALLTVKEKQTVLVRDSNTRAKAVEPFRGVFWLLLGAQLLGMIANGVGNMGRSFAMNDLKYSSTAMTTTAAVGGLFSVPIPLVLGWLSDKFGRKKAMIASYLAGTACLLLLIFSLKLWHFMFAAALLSMLSVCMSVGPAFVTDIVKRENVGTGVSLFQSAQWLGTIVGFVYSGFAFQQIGMRTGLAVALTAGILASMLILIIRVPSRLKETEESTV